MPYAGPANIPYHRYASLVPAQEKEKSFFDGVDVSLAGIADLAHGQENGFLKGCARRASMPRLSAL